MPKTYEYEFRGLMLSLPDISMFYVMGVGVLL